MTHEDFNKLLEDRLAKTRAVLAAKSQEYATDGDKLHNFKRAGALQGIHPAKALIGMWAKHLVSVLDLADDVARGDVSRLGLLDEKIGDAVNYLILLEALMTEPKG